MFIVDALLGNFDRHNGNWGILVDEGKQTAEIAPVYDCGSCLYPQLAVKEMQGVLGKEEEIDGLVDGTPFLETIQKEFYRIMIRERKEKILDYSMEKLLEQEAQGECLNEREVCENARVTGFASFFEKPAEKDC